MSAFLLAGTRFSRYGWRNVGAGVSLLLALPVMAADTPAGVSPNLPDPYIAGRSTPTKNAAAEFHVFTDPKGNTLKAQILGMVNTTVNLKRDDGQNFQAALATFTKIDQTYIIEVLLQQYIARGQVVLELTAVTDKTTPAATKIDGGTRQTWKENYRLTIKNQTSLALGDLQAHLIIFKALQLPDVPGATSSSVVLLGQSQSLTTMPPDGKTTLEADQVTMEQVLANDGGQFPNAPAVHSETDKLLAVWIRIYDRNDFLVQEWCSMPDLMKKQSWADAWALASGAARK